MKGIHGIDGVTAVKTIQLRSNSRKKWLKSQAVHEGWSRAQAATDGSSSGDKLKMDVTDDAGNSQMVNNTRRKVNCMQHEQLK